MPVVGNDWHEQHGGCARRLSVLRLGFEGGDRGRFQRDGDAKCKVGLTKLEGGQMAVKKEGERGVVGGKRGSGGSGGRETRHQQSKRCEGRCYGRIEINECAALIQWIFSKTRRIKSKASRRSGWCLRGNRGKDTNATRA
jgi:hypothetical protein